MPTPTNRTVIEAPIKLVWETLHDITSILQWQPDIKAAVCLERDRDGRPVLIHTILDTVVRPAEATLTISYDDALGVMHWEKLHGDVPAFTGSWTVNSVAPDRTSVEYRLRIDFGNLGKMVRGPIAGAQNNIAGSSMPEKLKSYVESLRPDELERR